jgi:hypothetical protein
LAKVTAGEPVKLFAVTLETVGMGGVVSVVKVTATRMTDPAGGEKDAEVLLVPPPVMLICAGVDPSRASAIGYAW